ncbi:MAG TPA: DUF1634 domain-containing protein [Gemmataceae bacterium]|jgi:uncharacterized membrane protein|nr:DUF1634 domain-containing protein [Gemmataceae bacterium]
MADSLGWTDSKVEQIVGNLLRTGVMLAAVVVAAGGMLYLVRHGAESPDLHVFQGEPANLRTPMGVATDVCAGSARGVIQLGILLLIATPVARVMFSVFAFGVQRDYTYVCITLVVLAVLLYSLFK